MIATPTAGATTRPVLRVAVDTPLATLLDYLPPPGPLPAPGVRVRVPFGRREMVGVVLAVTDHSGIGLERLRPAIATLDPEPLLGAVDIELLSRVSAYYHHPIGEVVATALPSLLRQGRETAARTTRHWCLATEAHGAALARAPRQAALVAALHAAGGSLPEEALRARFPDLDLGRLLGALARRGLIVAGADTPGEEAAGEAGLDAEGGADAAAAGTPPTHPPVTLTADQQAVLALLLTATPGPAVHLLEGVTGSGKTEVYLRLIEAELARGRQSLLLVPEIALSDQTLDTLAARIRAPVALLHSAVGDAGRARAWRAAARGEARVVLGTRSAVWTPLPELGLIIVDEEHDTSFKQGDGLRYSARDVAVLRGHVAGVPVLLGSATPSLETWHNARRGRYRHHRLPVRVGARQRPTVEVADIRGQPLDGGLGPRLLVALETTLREGGQCLLFLNRRGYAPVLMCHACGWSADCPRCDTHLTWHREADRLRCHHCLGQRHPPLRCPQCGGEAPTAVGHGTERLMEVLARRFPDVAAIRVDTDSTRRAGSLARSLAAIRTGTARILVGTQMLAKGHHFPELTLAAVVDADDRLYSPDFRARERLMQLLLQVGGRSGRGARSGRLLIQTHHPAHPLFGQVVAGDYAPFADAELAERSRLGLPPTAHAALLRAEAPDDEAPLAFLEAARALGTTVAAGPVRLLGPIPSALARRAGRHRAQLWIEADGREALHGWLRAWVPGIGRLKLARKVRWALDVDPHEVL
jgi:primosomal protein N' (replication factor Y)